MSAFILMNDPGADEIFDVDSAVASLAALLENTAEEDRIEVLREQSLALFEPLFYEGAASPDIVLGEIYGLAARFGICGPEHSEALREIVSRVSGLQIVEDDDEEIPFDGPSTSRALPITIFDRCNELESPDWIFKALLARNETSSWVGPPASGKSAFLTDLAVHGAAGRDWQGHRSTGPTGVLILALERADLYRRRLQAYRLRDGFANLPIAIASDVIDLLHPTCVDTIVATSEVAGQQLGIPIGLIVVDTFSKAIAAGGGDEDKARDQNRAAAHLRQIQSRLNVHIALVGHTGKDESRGARGSNAHLGDVDLMIQIGGDGTKTAAVIKANDQAERELAEFTITGFEIGRDGDGDPVTTSIISIVGPAQSASSAGQTARGTISATTKGFLEALSTIGPTGQMIADEAWKAECDRRGLIDLVRKAASARSLFSRHKRTLIEAGLVGSDGSFSWFRDVKSTVSGRGRNTPETAPETVKVKQTETPKIPG